MDSKLPCLWSYNNDEYQVLQIQCLINLPFGKHGTFGKYPHFWKHAGFWKLSMVLEIPIHFEGGEFNQAQKPLFHYKYLQKKKFYILNVPLTYPIW